MEKYGFFLDIDNTLFTDGYVCNKNIQAVKEARLQGHFVFINTARSFCNIPEEVKEIPVDGYISSLGGSVKINGKNILGSSLDIDLLAEELDYMNERKKAFVIEGENVMISNPFFEGGHTFSIVSNGNELKEKFGKELLPKVFIPYYLTNAETEFFSRNHTVFQHKKYAEYGAEGCSKSTGMLLAAEKCGIKKENCVAMGDSVNDADMLKSAGISVAMGDAHEDIKAMCSMVTCDARDGGVAFAICRIAGIKCLFH